MAATIKQDVFRAFEITKEEDIAAPIDIVFETILEQMGPSTRHRRGPCR